MKLIGEQLRVRNELNSQGWTLVNVRRFLKKNPFLARSAFTARYLVQPFGKKKRKLPPYAKYINDLLLKSLYDENIDQNLLIEGRYYIGNKIQTGLEGRFHLDGGYIRYIIPLFGETTEFKPSKSSKKIKKVPHYHAFIFTAKYRQIVKKIQATVHRGPAVTPTAKNRKLIVGSYQLGADSVVPVARMAVAKKRKKK